MEAVKGFHEQDTETKKQYYSRDYVKKVVYNSNFDLYTNAVANWRDSLYLIMAPDPPTPQELPQIFRYKLSSQNISVDDFQYDLQYQRYCKSATDMFCDVG